MLAADVFVKLFLLQLQYRNRCNSSLVAWELLLLSFKFSGLFLSSVQCPTVYCLLWWHVNSTSNSAVETLMPCWIFRQWFYKEPSSCLSKIIRPLIEINQLHLCTLLYCSLLLFRWLSGFQDLEIILVLYLTYTLLFAGGEGLHCRNSNPASEERCKCIYDLFCFCWS